jgi:uncharacterized membrane protein
MDLGPALVMFAHVLGGTVWLGGSVFVNFVLLPFVFGQPLERQRELVRTAILGPERMMIAAAVGGGAFGILLGTVFGRIRSFDDLATFYGLVWLSAILVAVVVFAIGGTVTSPAARRLLEDDRLWSSGAAAGRHTVVLRLRRGFALELTGIVVILVLMAVLRYL